MQQLNWRQEADRLLAQTDLNTIDGEQFVGWAQQWASHFALQAIDWAFGADRAQMHFRYQDTDYLILYEGLCEALWVEALTNKNRTKLDKLYAHLIKKG